MVEEKRKKISEKINELKGKLKGTKGLTRESYEKELRKVEGSLIDEILSLKVLDPAMGSGHFLVEAITFLARALIEAFGESPEETGEDEIRWARREVVERCIFGVDLNPMAVELAKLSLWLYTVAKGKPLNFLDHHLKCGNSLIGAKVEDLYHLPEKKKKNKDAALSLSLPMEFPALTIDLGLAVGDYLLIEKIASEDVKDIKKKTELYQNLNKERIDKWRDIANIWISSFFGVKIDQKLYKAFSDYILGKEERIPKEWVEEYLNKALNLAKEKNFFHWELEFPEVFFDHHGKQLITPGFDAVVGNPPYERTKYLLQDQSAYDRFFKTAFGAYDIYVLFIEKSLSLISSIGNFSFIVSNKFLISDYGNKLRDMICKDYNVTQLIDLTECPSVFKDALISPLVIVANKRKSDFVYIAVFKKDFPEEISKLSDTFHQYIDCIETELVDIERRPAKELRHPETGHFNIYLVGNKKRLERKMYSNALILKKLMSIRTGVMGFEYWSFEPHITEVGSPSSDYLKLLTPSLIDKYEILWGTQPIDIYKHNLRYPVLNIRNAPINNITREFFVSSKIVVRGTARKLSAALDTEGHALLVAIHGILYHSLTDALFLLSLINSRLLNWLHIISYYSARIPQGSLRYPISFYENLPIRRIAFVTPKEVQEKVLRDAKNHYKMYLESAKPDAVFNLVESSLMKEHKPDAELVKKHNADPLNKDWQIPEGILWEQSDVVHDALAFLAEQMIEMNKDKQREIKGFLGWLESQLKIQSGADGNSGIEALTGKTQIKNYLGDYQKGEEDLPFEEFWKILEKNKTRIQTNLKARDLYENIKAEYEKSLSKLLPLKEKLHKTDWLIDQIVYKLYGLTEDEIKIVEGKS
ncbi:MAG: hypothetical protein A2Y65_00575 [Deltaproteobacteria bacterium RBG_13_52_11]|nr:MAG: hypothetical protein A2Y65_00575 [Deltaproteobacteria bacterium RBG_13_52_11]